MEEQQNVIANGICGNFGDNLTWELYDTGELVISGTGEMEEFVYSAPWRKKDLLPLITSVTIKPGVTSIGFTAFSACASVKSIIIPEGVSFIGWGAFNGCEALESINIPNSVDDIADAAFEGCSALPVVDNIRYADTCAVEAVGKTLSTYTLREGTRYICGGAFKNCIKLTHITIPESVVSIGSSAFQFCLSLKDINIPQGVTCIYDETFYACSALENIKIPKSVIFIGEGAFCDCTSLKSITIPDSVTSFGKGIFMGCSALVQVQGTNGDDLSWLLYDTGEIDDSLLDPFEIP